MALTERKIIDKIEIIENGSLQIREANVIEKDGNEIARTFHRYVLEPGQDLTDRDEKIISIANVVWTAEVIETYRQQHPEPPELPEQS